MKKHFLIVLPACLWLVIAILGSSCHHRLSLPGDVSDRRDWVSAAGSAGRRDFSSERLVFPLELRWKASARGPIVASPTVIGELICVGTLGRRFSCFSAGDGRRHDAMKTDAGVSATAAFGEGTVFLATESGEGIVRALDFEEGDIRWETPVGDVSAALTYCRGRILVSTNQGRLCCLAAEDGSRMWQFSTRGRKSTAVTVSEDMAVCGCDDGYLYALGIDDGVERWSRQLEGAVWAAPVADDGRIYAGTFGGYLYCLAADDGAIIWRQDTEGNITRPLALGPETVFAGTDRGTLLAMARRNGQLRWTYRLSDARPGAPVATADALLVGDSDGRILALNVDDGTLLWSYQTGRAIVSAPVMRKGRLFVGSMNGYLYAFAPADSGAASHTSNRMMPSGP